MTVTSLAARGSRSRRNDLYGHSSVTVRLQKNLDDTHLPSTQVQHGAFGEKLFHVRTALVYRRMHDGVSRYLLPVGTR